MDYRRDSIWKRVDWWTISLYLILIICGWFSICGASYDYGEPNFFDFATRSGKQLVWMGCAVSLGFIILMVEERIYETYAYLLYGLMILILFGTIFNPTEIKGSRSWIVLGPVSLQPAEFAKFATALALGKLMGEYSFSIQRFKHLLSALLIILVPMLLIIMQRETGSALVYLTFFLVLYREGMTGTVLFAGICAVVYFVVGVKFGMSLMPDEVSSWGEVSTLSIILFLSIGLMVGYGKRNLFPSQYVFLGTLLLLLIAILVSTHLIAFNVAYVLWGLIGLMIIYLLYHYFKMRLRNYLYIAFFLIGSVTFFFSTEYVFEKVLEPHQRIRIEVLLGMEDDPAGAGYNVNQSKIAIGSGGLLGKGFLNGTQTKLKYVPEQDTDFIFCTVGEEEGFVGSSIVLILFATLILRLIYLAERQTYKIARVYGYGVLCIFFFHLFINVGMVLGLTPVIGIPLPFFSYGGSSLWSFTILLFVFLRLDASRKA